MRIFEVKAQLDGYTDDFIEYGSLFELHAKSIRSMFVKDKDWSWFSKKDNHIRKEDKKVYNFLNKYKN